MILIATLFFTEIEYILLFRLAYYALGGYRARKGSAMPSDSRIDLKLHRISEFIISAIIRNKPV